MTGVRALFERAAHLRDRASARLRRRPWTWGVVGAVLLAGIPLLSLAGGDAGVGRLELIWWGGLFVLMGLALNVVPGFCGLLDLGFAGFVCVGAYTGALLTAAPPLGLGMPWPLALVPVFLMGAAWGVALGVPTLRLTGDYFAIVTFGFSELVVLLSINWERVTGGPQGFRNIPGLEWWEALVRRVGETFGAPGAEPRLHPVTGEPMRGADGSILTVQDWFTPAWMKAGEWITLALVIALVVFMMRRLLRARPGRAWLAIRNDPVAAECCGINLVRYKVEAFALSAGIGAVAGALLAAHKSYINPTDFKFILSVQVLCVVVLGGMGNVWGVVIGGALLGPLDPWVRSLINEQWVQENLGIPSAARYLVFGALLILIMRFRPQGLLPYRPPDDPAAAAAADLRGGEPVLFRNDRGDRP